MKHLIEMPPYTVARKRKNWTSYYFIVPAAQRPARWPETIPLSNDVEKGIDAIHAQASALYARYKREKRDHDLQNEHRHPKGSFPDIVEKYQQSAEWLNLSEATRKSYLTPIGQILNWSKKAGNPHIERYKTKHFYAFLAKFSDRPRQQKYVKSILSLLVGAAVRQGHCERNLINEITLPRNVKDTGYKIIPWTEQNVADFISKADEMGYGSIGTAVLIAFDAGQRQTDVLRLQHPRDYKNGRFVYEQSKTGQEVSIPATNWLRSRLDKIPRQQMVLCACEKTGGEWNVNMFKKRFKDIAIAAGLPKHQFRQLRHSHLIMLERAGCTDHERNSHSGHSRNSGNAMMDKSYGLDRDAEAATSATVKLEEYRGKGLERKG